MKEAEKDIYYKGYVAGYRAGMLDAAKLDANTIATMRNLGPKTAAEIACCLDSLGICHSAWNAYL